MVVLANVLQNQGDYQGAIDWYEKAVGIKPDDVELRLAFGQALYSYGQLFDAEVQYKKAIEWSKSAKAEYYGPALPALLIPRASRKRASISPARANSNRKARGAAPPAARSTASTPRRCRRRQRHKRVPSAECRVLREGK